MVGSGLIEAGYSNRRSECSTWRNDRANCGWSSVRPAAILLANRGRAAASLDASREPVLTCE